MDGDSRAADQHAAAHINTAAHDCSADRQAAQSHTDQRAAAHVNAVVHRAADRHSTDCDESADSSTDVDADANGLGNAQSTRGRDGYRHLDQHSDCNSN